MQIHRLVIVPVLLATGIEILAAEKPSATFRPEIPRIWDEHAFAGTELPVVVPNYSPKPVPADYYYKIPTRTIYKSYPVYAPGRAPVGYMDRLKTVEPEVAFDVARLKTKDDWTRAGELVFEAPTFFDEPTSLDENWYAHTGVRLTNIGINPYFRYVVRQKGKVELGALSCATCHLSVLEDGTVIKAGQGNFPLAGC